MSIRVMNLVWENAPYQENTLLTLLALADWSSEAGVSWPSMETLAKKSRQSVRNAQRTIKRLEKDGVLSIQYRKDNSSLYTINLKKINLGQNVTTPLTGDTGNIEGVTLEAKNVSQMSPNTSIEPSVEPSTPSNSVPSLEDSPAKDTRFPLFVDSLDKYWKHKNGGLPFTFGAADGKALKRFLAENPRLTVVQFQQALRNRAKSNVTHSSPVRYWIGKALETYNGSLDRFGKHSDTVASAPPQGRDDLADVIRQRGGPDALKRRHAERNG